VFQNAKLLTCALTLIFFMFLTFCHLFSIKKFIVRGIAKIILSFEMYIYIYI